MLSKERRASNDITNYSAQRPATIIRCKYSIHFTSEFYENLIISNFSAFNQNTNSERIEEFIDDNKALMRRMYGDSQTLKKSAKRKREATDFDGIPGVPDITAPYEDIVNLSSEYESHMGDSYFAKWRARRQANKANKPSKPNVELNPTSEPVSGR